MWPFDLSPPTSCSSSSDLRLFARKKEVLTCLYAGRIFLICSSNINHWVLVIWVLRTGQLAAESPAQPSSPEAWRMDTACEISPWSPACPNFGLLQGLCTVQMSQVSGPLWRLPTSTRKPGKCRKCSQPSEPLCREIGKLEWRDQGGDPGCAHTAVTGTREEQLEK